MVLRRKPGEKAKITKLSSSKIASLEDEKNKNASVNDQWEDLWKHYHKTINNESRDNPKLQKQFMPKRYWKYLPEI
jgi:probable DNA metabolism protein